VLANIDSDKITNCIKPLLMFHNCTFNGLKAYAKKGKLFPRTTSDNNQHVFCSYGKCWYKPGELENDSLFDLPITFGLKVDPLIATAIRVLAFDGGFAKDLHENKGESKFHFLKDYDFGNFLIEPSVDYINAFIEILYHTFENYFSPSNLEFDVKNYVVNNPNSNFKELFKDSSNVLNKVAWIVTQTQYGDPKLVSTIEFFFSEIDPKRINIAQLHLHPIILEHLDGHPDIQRFLEPFKYKQGLPPEEDTTEIVVQPRAFNAVTEGIPDNWDLHLKQVNKLYADSWI
ncbi:MAG: hypothetical protein K0U54_11860, partial [Bacteroidetes bacterium]|nr:hypothetical protein [Bacteroidota bacterium]